MTGVNSILRRLGSVKRAIDTGLFVNAVIQWAEYEFVPRAKARVPVDTGELRDSIAFEVSAAQVFVFASAPHASDVEFGTFKMRAQPYIRPAYQAARPLLSRYTRRAIRGINR
jgi:HK97 gp10 family phage protein